MASINPISDALLTLLDADAATKKARIDYEVAEARKAQIGRDAVPGVMAKLKQDALKKQKQQESITQSGSAQQQKIQASMMPETVQVTGQTGGRDMSGAFKSATEIARAVSGGSAIKQGAISGVFGQQSQQPGVGQGINPGAPAPPAGSTPQQAQGQLPAGINLGTGPPGSVVQVTRDLPWWEQALYIGGGLVTRSPQALVTGIRGEEVLGTRQIPTLDEQAKPYSQGLSVLVARSHSTDPALRDASQAQLDKARAEMEAKVGKDVTDTSFRQANDLWLLEDEQQRIKEEQPQWQKAQLELGIEQEVEEFGVDHLSPGRRAIWERGGRKGTTVNIQNQLQKSTRGGFEKKVEEGRQVMDYINAFDEAFFAPGFEALGKLDRGVIRAKEFAGLASEEEKGYLKRFTDQESAVAGLGLITLHPLIGSAMGVKEMERAEGYIVDMKRGGTAAQSASGNLREMIGLSLFRLESSLESGTVVDPRYSMSMGNTKNAAREAIFVRKATLQAQGLTEAEAVQQVRQDFKNRWGLDADRILGNQ